MKNNFNRFVVPFIILTILTSAKINEAIESYMQGELNLLEGNLTLAEIHFEEALGFDPSNPTILLSLLEIHIQNKQLSKIDERLPEYLNLEVLDINIALDILHLYKNIKEDSVLKILNLLINNNPDSIDLRYEKAKLLILNGDWEKLLIVYSDIYIINQDEELFNNLLNIGLTIENPKILYKTLEYIWKNTKTNLLVLELLIQFSYLEDENYKTKIYLQELLDYDPDNEFAITMLAEISILEKDFLRAITLLNKVKDAGKMSLDVYKMFLISYSNLGDYENEIRIGKQIINDFPYETLGYESLAISHLELGNYIRAVKVLNDAIELFPDEYYFYYYIGLCYRNSDRNSDAINYFLKALKLNPDLKNVMHELAKLYNLVLDYESSDSLFTILLQKNVNDAMILNDYAYLIADRNDVTMKKLNFALELSKDAILIEPNSPEYLDTVGWIYYRIGKYNKALDYLLKSQSLDKKNSIILEHLGDVYSKLGQYDKALEIYNRINIYSPNNVEIIEKMKLLNEK